MLFLVSFLNMFYHVFIEQMRCVLMIILGYFGLFLYKLLLMLVRIVSFETCVLRCASMG